MLSAETAWKYIFQTYPNQLKEMEKVVRAIFTIPMSSVQDERIFSRVSKI